MTTQTHPAAQRPGPDTRTGVVIGVDGSVANQAAVDFGTDLAAALSTPATLVSAVWGTGTIPTAVDPLEPGWQVLGDIAKAERARHPEAKVHTRVLFGDPTGCLLEAAEHAAVTVVGTRGLGTFSRAVLGSTSTAVAERTSGPVIVVPGSWKSTHVESDARVVVGVSVSGTAETGMLRWAFQEAARTGSPLDVVHAIDTEPMLIWDPLLGAAAYREWEEGTALRLQEELAPLRMEFPSVEVRQIERRGHPANVLLELAAGARLVVVGKHKRTAFGFGLGSTERGVLHYAEVPVAVVPPHA